MSTGYTHREAFCLMLYASDDSSIVERVWNSRDGDVPLCITARDGVTELRHIAWHRDVCAPNHHPAPDERIFINITTAHAQRIARKEVDAWWDHKVYPLHAHYPTKEAAAIVLATLLLADHSRPVLINAPEKDKQ